MDEKLKRAFAAAPVPGDDPAFIARVRGAVAGVERVRRVRRAVLGALFAVCAIALTPAAVELSLALAAAMLTPAGALAAVTLALIAGWTLVRPVLR